MTRAFGGWRDTIYVIFLGFSFSVASVVQSLHQGQLAAPITFDDNVYFVDALHRLQSFYDLGFRGLIAGYIANPPHSPIATAVAFVAFLFFGVHDWAPALVNSLLVILLLLAFRDKLRELPSHAVFAITIAVLAWPVLGFLVIESRPDVVNGFLIALACTTVVEEKWVGCDSRRLILVALLFAVALFAKPSVFPITLVLYACSLGVASLIDYLMSGRTLAPGAILAQNTRCLALTAAIVAPYYVLAVQREIEYIRLTTFGGEKDLWAVKLPFYEQASFYLWGEPGGARTMGPWLFIALATMAAASLVNLMRGRRPSPRIGALAGVFLVSFALVTVPAHKSVFLGIQVSCFFLTFFVLACRSLYRALPARGVGRVAPLIVSILLIGAAAATAQWHWFARTATPVIEPGPILAARRALLDAAIAAVDPANENGARVYLPAITPYFNSDTLNYELLKKGASAEAFDTHRSGDAAEHLRQIATATHVVLFAPNDADSMRWLPSYQSLPAVAAAVRSDPGLHLIASLAAPLSGGPVEIYARARPFEKIKFIAGFGPEEGPYPQWRLPRVRWALGDAAEIEMPGFDGKNAVLHLRALSAIADQSVTILVAQKALGDCLLPDANSIVSCEIPLGAIHSGDRVEFRFKRAGQAQDNQRSVLFLEIGMVETP